MAKVLLIEDSPVHAKHFSLMLQEAGFDVEHADQLKSGLARLDEGGVDVLLLDLTLPDSEGLRTFLTAQARSPSTPIVVLTGLDDESLAATALHQGAQDYLVKGEVNQSWLMRSVQHAIARGKPKRPQPQQSTEPHSPRTIIDIKKDGEVTVVRINEKRLLNATDIELFGEQLHRAVDSGCRKMLLRFANVDYVSNGAMGALIALRKKMAAVKGTVRLCELSPQVYENLTVRQFHKLFEIHDDFASALRSFASS